MTTELHVELRPLADGRRAVSLAGEVDVTKVARFRESLTQAIGSDGCLVDLTGLTYLDSAGIEVLFDVARRTPLAIVAGPASTVRRVLDVVSLGMVAAILDESPA